MLKLIQFSFAAARTRFAGFSPRLFAADVRFPEGPGFALARAGFIDFAFTRFGVEEDAVVAFGEFNEAATDADVADVFFFASGGSNIKEFGEDIDFFLRDPDVAGRSSAAVAAAGALETQAVGVPGSGWRLRAGGWFFLGHIDFRTCVLFQANRARKEAECGLEACLNAFLTGAVRIKVFNERASTLAPQSPPKQCRYLRQWSTSRG